MFDRYATALRIGCYVLAALLLFQVSRMIARRDPLRSVTIPSVPTLPTNNVVAATNTSKISTNLSQAKSTSSNLVQSASTNANAPTNRTNVLVSTNNAVTTHANSATNRVSMSNAVASTPGAATNGSASNTVAVAQGARPSGAPNLPGGMARPGAAPVLPPDVQTRVDKIVQSEILAAVVRPLPMALLGIAGDSAFLRSTNGQSGVVQVGGELGGLKLLKIGTNRVLVEVDGEPKELMVFTGLGGETLLPKENEKKVTPK